MCTDLHSAPAQGHGKSCKLCQESVEHKVGQRCIPWPPLLTTRAKVPSFPAQSPVNDWCTALAKTLDKCVCLCPEELFLPPLQHRKSNKQVKQSENTNFFWKKFLFNTVKGREKKQAKAWCENEEMKRQRGVGRHPHSTAGGRCVQIRNTTDPAV